MIPIEVLSSMLSVRDFVHCKHLATSSFAEHKALGEFYDQWLDLVDDFMETWQGKYGRVIGGFTITINPNQTCIEYLEGVRNLILEDYESVLPGEDEDLENILADMLGLVNKTLYLLTLS